MDFREPRDEPPLAAELREAVRKHPGRRERSFSAEKFLDMVVERWGGIDQLVNTLYVEFHSPKATPGSKARYLELILRLANALEARRGLKHTPKSEMSTEDLLRQYDELAGRLRPSPDGDAPASEE